MLILALLTGAVAVYAAAWVKQVDELRASVDECFGSADGDTAEAIDKSISLLKEKRAFLHMTLRQSKIEALVTVLTAARSYCAAGNEEEMRRCLNEAAGELDRWREAENIPHKALRLYGDPGFNPPKI